MTLDEAISVFKERAEDSKKISELGMKSYIPKAKEEEQLAEWLEELKSYRASVFSGDMTQRVNKLDDKKIAYICSPYRGNIFKRIRNIRYARELTERAINAGFLPITPHLYLTQVLNDKKPQEREKGMSIGLDLLRKCDVVFVGEKYGISEGMRAEINVAELRGKAIWRL